MADTTKTHKYRNKYSQLMGEIDDNSWRTHWKDIADYMQPRSGRFLESNDEKSNDGKKKHSKIINGVAHDASRTLAAGLQGGLTSPSRPWFVLEHPDEQLMEYAPVKEWMHQVRQLMLNTFARTNFYASIHNVYRELGLFGTGAMLLEEDFKTAMRCRPFTIGEFMLALDSQYRPESLYRRFDLTARQCVQAFGEKHVSDSIKEAWKNNASEHKFKIIHAVEPNRAFDFTKDDASGKGYESVYFEESADPEKLLRKSGYDTIPFVAPRWDVNGTDTYGDSPGMEALGDVKQLQKMEEKKLKALDKMVDPPLNAPNEMKNKGTTIVAGGVNYSDAPQGISPAFQVRPDLQNMAYEGDRVESRIKRFFYNDLFLMIANDSRSNVTATEISARHEEKLMMLGPILERLQSELLDPIIERTYRIMTNMGALPPVPKELQGQDLKIEYVSLLAQAQKIVGTAGIEQTTGFVGNLAAVNPEVLDKMDFDETVDQYATMIGVPPKIIRTDAQVAELRAKRAEANAKAQQAEQAMQRAEGAKVLSETQLNNGSALDALTGQI